MGKYYTEHLNSELREELERTLSVHKESTESQRPKETRKIRNMKRKVRTNKSGGSWR